jgi:ABC-type phosphate/phosphonate transport system substrate-binding protein
MTRRITATLVLMGLALAGGCFEATFSKSIWDPAHLQPLYFGKDPVRIGLVQAGGEDSLLNPAAWLEMKRPPWYALQRELSKELKRPVVVQTLKPFQVAAHLASGRIQIGMLPAADYLELIKDKELADGGTLGEVLALSEAGERRGVIVASAKSDIHSVADLKGRRFAFGPKGDPVLYEAALACLKREGLSVDDIAREIIPIPGSLQFHISSAEAAKEIVYGFGVGKRRTEAGVIEEWDYDSFPDTGGRLLPLIRFSKDQFRVLARTDPVASGIVGDGPVLASPDADPDLAATVRDFLLAAADKHQGALRDLGIKQFRPAPSDAQAEIERLSMLTPRAPAATQPE